MFTGGWPGYNGCAPDPLPDPACYGMPIRDGIKTIDLHIIVMKQNNKFCVAMQTTLSSIIEYLIRGDYNFINIYWQNVAMGDEDTYNGIRLAGQHSACVINSF